MKLIFLYGMPATGKLTVAQELAAITGYKLFHNHLVVDLLLSVFEFGSPPFVQLREEIWLSFFDQACKNDLPGLIFTFAPEKTVRPEFIPNVIKLTDQANAELDFIELQCPMPELKARMENPSRQQFGKLASRPLFEQLHAAGIFDTTHMPEPHLTIDTSLHTPPQAARQIGTALGIFSPGEPHPNKQAASKLKRPGEPATHEI
jgi:hypothetical protein